MLTPIGATSFRAKHLDQKLDATSVPLHGSFNEEHRPFSGDSTSIEDHDEYPDEDRCKGYF
jgi:hypothetical protein